MRCKFIGRFLCVMLFSGAAIADDNWFEVFKRDASDAELYRFLYAMPKGGDLHNHISGAGFSEWWYRLALQQEERGYRYYTKVRIENCRDYGTNEFSAQPYLLLFQNILSATYDKLPDCEKREYKSLAELSSEERLGWQNSIRLDKPHEGRDEFFQTHWQRLNELYKNPYIIAELIYLNMKYFGEEGLLYFEPQVGVHGFLRADGGAFSPDEVAAIYRERIRRADARKTGVTVRFQSSLLRFHPRAEEILGTLYRFVHNNSDLWVAVNMVGREDNDKGYPLRFLPTLRKLRRQYPGVKLSIHAGEVDEPNRHVRDTLLLGADRIGHGINLIDDPDTLLAMRHGPYLVEINLISNLLLEYVNDYGEHPFPEYLRTGVPVALSTDDRGMWDSIMTDEFFVAVKEFNLSWEELVLLGRNSLAYSFADEETRGELVDKFERRVAAFERRAQRGHFWTQGEVPVPRGFICAHYELCALN
ncbi:MULTISPECIES: adenosine deaminase [unclassified Microbulbifer]|uniref:adenosine deaminase family protein n=1 Tax=unclassified Microbulbifer TaxID=2619833 RepID=UPI0027E43644|nr:MULTISPECIES: adenosine deaminase [unclassified Microbulbifer]